MKLQMSLSDEIYHELMTGLEQGLDYDEIRLEYESTKGSLYNALTRVFSDVRSKLSELSFQIQAQEKTVNENEVMMRSLQKEANEVEQAIEVKRQKLAAIEKEIEVGDRDLKEMTILLVDDEQDKLDLIRALLGSKGFSRVFMAKSGREAIETLRNYILDANCGRIGICPTDLVISKYPSRNGLLECPKGGGAC